MNHSSSTLSPNTVVPPMCAGVSPGQERRKRRRRGGSASPPASPPSRVPSHGRASRPLGPPLTAALTPRRHAAQAERLPLPDVCGQQRRQPHHDRLSATAQERLAARSRRCRRREEAVTHSVLRHYGPPDPLHGGGPGRAGRRRSASPRGGAPSWRRAGGGRLWRRGGGAEDDLAIRAEAGAPRRSGDVSHRRLAPWLVPLPGPAPPPKTGPRA